MSDATADADVVPEACDMNLGPRQRRRRLRLGIVTGLTVAIALALMIALDVSRFWRLSLSGLFNVSMLGFIQYRAKT